MYPYTNTHIQPRVQTARITVYGPSESTCPLGNKSFYMRKFYPNIGAIACNFDIASPNIVYVTHLQHISACIKDGRIIDCTYCYDTIRDNLHILNDTFGHYLLPFYLDCIKDWKIIKQKHQEFINKKSDTELILDVTADLQ
jgi:hypothetical protein